MADYSNGRFGQEREIVRFDQRTPPPACAVSPVLRYRTRSAGPAAASIPIESGMGARARRNAPLV
jgi:hypothetical protein